MGSSRACESKKCREKTVVFHDDSGNMVCESCGLVQSTGDTGNLQSDIGGITGDKGTYFRPGSTGTDYNYKETKIYHAQNSIVDCLYRLGLSSRHEEVKDLIEKVTDGEYGQGEWFPVLVGACAYIVMRKNHKTVPMVNVADTIGCDAHELGRMVSRVVDFADLKLPEFDIVNAFESAVTSFSSSAAVSKDVEMRMLQQGVFLMQCLIKWFITTGRRPMPVVAAVLVFVAELNQVDVKMEDVAMKLLVATATCRLRYKELLQKLVEVAQALPWGKDVTVKNIIKNAPFVIKYMEMKSMTEKNQSTEHFECDVEQLVSNCLSKETGYEYGYGYGYDSSSKYFELDSLPNRPDKFQISHESLTMIYSNFLEEVEAARAEIDLVSKRKRRRVADVEEYTEWWEGKSEMSKKLILKKIMEKDVGLDCMPPSFDRACVSTEKRQEKIKAAKMRIGRIMNPRGDCSELSSGKSKSRKGKKRKVSVDIDWEDLIIETLLLHSVKEEEIEKGHYNVLLELYVFDHGY